MVTGVWTDGLTDGHDKLVMAFENFAKEIKKQ
jgi:hypothetical protein